MVDYSPEEQARRDDARRAALISVKRQKTYIARWAGIHERTVDPLWTARARAAVELIPPGRTVLDIGCNSMMIEPMLPPGSGYVPLDVARRDARTIVVDLNVDDLPETGADFALGLGVLEYFFNVPRFLRSLAARFDEGLLSYHPFERSPGRDRLAVGWVNAMTSHELIALLNAAGFGKVEVTEYKAPLHFYRISKE